MSGFVAVGYFLFGLFFSLLSFVLWTRIALRYFRLSSLHPLNQSLNKLTNPFTMPLSNLFNTSTNKKRLSRYDWACFFVLVLVEILKFTLIGLLFVGAQFPWHLLPVYVLADLIVQPCNLLFYAIIIRVIMSWVNPRWQHPLADLLRLVTEPLLRLGRRIIPDISGFDFSPYIMLIILKVITLFISESLPLHLI